MAGDPTEVSRVGNRGVIMNLTGRTRTFTPLGAALGEVSLGADPAKRDVMTKKKAETGVREGVKATLPPTPQQYGKIQRGGGQNNWEGVRSS